MVFPSQLQAVHVTLTTTTTSITNHVIWSLAGVPERRVFWHKSVEHHLHVVADVRVPILVDGQARRRVQQLKEVEQQIVN